MNNKYVFLSLALALTLLPACWFNSASNAKLLVVNVLDKAEYDDCHIKGSINVPFDEVEQFAKGLNKETELVFYCSNYWCTGSGHAATQATELGFTKVWAYEAGMAQWYQEGLPVEGQAKAAYLTKKIEKPAKESPVKEISTQELKEKMEQAGLL